MPPCCVSRASPRASEQRSSVIPVFASDRQRLHDPEHEIPIGPYNTHMGDLTIKCPPTPVDTPVVIVPG